jgi:nucleotide-binding universal stress UspA family protein
MEVTLVHVVSSLTHYVVAGEASARIPYTETEVKQIKQGAMTYLKKTGKTLRSAGAIVKYEVRVGQAANEITKTANEINTNLIAMSTHGRSGLSRWAFGSVTDKVLRGGNKPILMVRVPKETTQT